MRLWILMVVGLALLSAGCSEPETCDPECSWWQTCLAGECRASTGHCDTHEDCEGERPVCHQSDRVCVEEGDPCALCEEWEECREEEECVPKPGRCSSSVDCPTEAPACATATNVCVVASAPHVLSSPVGVIITSDSLAPAFERLAAVHTLTGTPTRVITVEEICGPDCSTTDTRTDAAARIKAWLNEQADLRYVLLGGGLAAVPSRWVHASYSNSLAQVSFEEDFVSDFYYSDLSEWDKNGNGVYAEPSDLPTAGETFVLDYEANLAVARLPVSSAAEVERYTDKVIEYLVHKDLSSAREALLLSNVATTLDLGFSTVEVDGGRYFDLAGRTIDIFPGDMSLVKLYALGPTDESPDAVTLTVALQKAEMEKGPNLIVHSGHGDVTSLTVEEFGGNDFTGQHAFDLRNSEYPIMLSCACLAADFSDPSTASAGERLVNAPNGGAIGYMGNTTVGLGLAGGSQLIDEFLRCAFAQSNPRVGDCLVSAHDQFTYPDELDLPFIGSVTVVDRDSWEWTKKSAVYFGDPMIPVVSDPSTQRAPIVQVAKTWLGDVSLLAFTIDSASQGVLMAQVEGEYYRLDIGAGDELAITVPSDPGSIRVGLVVEGSMPFYDEHTF